MQSWSQRLRTQLRTADIYQPDSDNADPGATKLAYATPFEDAKAARPSSPRPTDTSAATQYYLFDVT